MTREQSLSPRGDLRYPMIQKQERGDASKEHDRHEDDDEAPGRDAEVNRVEHVEGHPRADVDEAGAVQDKVDDGGKDLSFDHGVEITVPGECRACTAHQLRPATS